MSLYIGQHKAKVVHIGDKMIKRVYLGNAIVYQYDLSVTSTLVGCSATLPTTVYYGEPLVAALVPDTGYQQLPWNTKVTMGGEDITSTAYDAATNSINITEVTGDISIEAEAVTALPERYVPMEYIECHTKVSSPGLATYIYATERSRLEVDIQYASNTTPLIWAQGRSVSYVSNVKAGLTAASQITQWVWNEKRITTGKLTPVNQKYHVVISRDLFEIRDREGNLFASSSITDPTQYAAEFTSAYTTSFLGNKSSVASGGVLGKVWRAKHYIDGVLENDNIPAIDTTNNRFGLYDNVKGLFISPQQNAWVGPNVTITRSYANCTSELLTGTITGTVAKAVIGSTWSIKITPTSGYTFTGGTTPQVEIDGVDVTSTTVTDNGDGTYTVTIVDVPDKPIEITAACVADPNAVQSNSLLTGTPTNTPDEPMGDNGENEEEM